MKDTSPEHLSCSVNVLSRQEECSSVVSLVVDNLVSKITWKINPRVVNTEEGFGRGLNFNTC